MVLAWGNSLSLARGISQRFLYLLPLVTAMILFYAFSFSCGRNENRKKPLPIDSATNTENSITKVAGFGAGIGGGNLGGLGGGDNPPYEEDGYVVYEQGDLMEGIMPIIGPVVRTFTSTDETGSLVNVNEIGFHDPFTKVYQVVESGTIIMTNADISQSIAPPLEYYPSEETWVDPDTGETFRVISGQVIAWFDETADMLWLTNFLTANDFRVAMSRFEPKEDGSPGNQVAYFQLKFGSSWNGVDEVMEFLRSQPHVTFTSPVFLEFLQQDYAPPNDPLYAVEKNEHVDLLRSVSNP